MKKFSLLALVAVMVMAFAGAAFAADGDITALGNVDSSVVDVNNGAVAAAQSGSDYATKLYTYGDLENTTSLKVGVAVTVENTTSGANGKAIKGLWNEGTLATDTILSSTAAAQTDANKTTFTFENSTINNPLTIGVFDASYWVGDVQKTLAITKTAVVFPTAEITKGKSADQEVELRFTKDVALTANVVVAVVPTDLAKATFGKDFVVTGHTDSGLTVAASSTKDGVTISGTPTKAGTYTITVTTDAAEDSLKVKETSTGSDIVVAAKADALNGKEVAKIKVVVELAKTNNATFLPDDKTTVSFFVEDVTSALVISTDISTDKVPAAKSADLKLYVGDDALNAKSFDVALAAAGYTFSLPVATQQDLAPITAASVYVTDDTNVMTNKLALSITNKSVYPVDQPTAEQKAAIEALVAGSADLGLTTAVSHDADRAFVSDDIPSAISNDVRGYFEIDQAVPNNGDYVAMDGTRFTTNKKTGESVTFFKNFGTNEDPDRISLRDAMSGDVLQAAVLIVDNELPANVQGAWKSAKDSKKGVVIRKVNGTNVVVIYDGNKNGRVVDPIEARVNRGSSSSSCDMGFGLAAVAGLAALALRKRSK